MVFFIQTNVLYMDEGRILLGFILRKGTNSIWCNAPQLLHLAFGSEEQEWCDVLHEKVKLRLECALSGVCC